MRFQKIENANRMLSPGVSKVSQQLGGLRVKRVKWSYKVN